MGKFGNGEMAVGVRGMGPRIRRPLHNRHSGESRNPESNDLAMARVVPHRYLNAFR